MVILAAFQWTNTTNRHSAAVQLTQRCPASFWAGLCSRFHRGHHRFLLEQDLLAETSTSSVQPQTHNTLNIYTHMYICLFSLPTMVLPLLTCSPPPSPVSVVWSLDFGSLRFSQTALTGVSPAEQDQPGNPGAASEWLSGPAQHTHTIVIRASRKQRVLLLLPLCAAAAVYWRHVVSAATDTGPSYWWAASPSQHAYPPTAEQKGHIFPL